jgi:hypothetical protein
MKITKKDLEMAERLIKKDDPLIYDAAANMFPAQIVGNVKHTTAFKMAVARWLKENKEEIAYWKRQKLKKVV